MDEHRGVGNGKVLERVPCSDGCRRRKPDFRQRLVGDEVRFYDILLDVFVLAVGIAGGKQGQEQQGGHTGGTGKVHSGTYGKEASRSRHGSGGA